MQGGYNYIHFILESDIFTLELSENSWSHVWVVGRRGGGGDKVRETHLCTFETVCIGEIRVLMRLS